jgi:hypothetical protein
MSHKEVGPRRMAGLDSFNRELIRAKLNGWGVRIVDADIVVSMGGGESVAVS